MSRALEPPTSAGLEDPLYYLRNFESVVNWVRHHHPDLLVTEELVRLHQFDQLAEGARALLARLVMRKGELFRSDRLTYPELGMPESEAISQLMEHHWVSANPVIRFEQACERLTLPELRTVWRDSLSQKGLRSSLNKRDLVAALATDFPEPRPASELGFSDPTAPLLKLEAMALFDRIRLLFFGTLNQDWSDFVLVQLGLQRYEEVPLTPDSRAFHHRDDVDGYLALHHCHEQLQQQPACVVWPTVPPGFPDNPWLESRRSRLLFELGIRAEREGERDIALNALADSGHREARLRRLRLLERRQDYQRAWRLAQQAAESPRNVAEQRGLQRLLKRLAGKVGEPAPTSPPPPELREWHLELPHAPETTVELAVAGQLGSEDTPVFYVENTLFNGLFALLCWPALYTPLPGAFFHPFQSGPADLYREDFVSRRQREFDHAMASLKDGSYRTRIQRHWDIKQGISNPFFAWQVLSEELLSLALDCIPAQALSCIFDRLLEDLREHRSGLPDLIQFDRQTHSFQLIEVKGPGDRLQEHQRQWLEVFADQGIPASVCYASWPANTGEDDLTP